MMSPEVDRMSARFPSRQSLKKHFITFTDIISAGDHYRQLTSDTPISCFLFLFFFFFKYEIFDFTLYRLTILRAHITHATINDTVSFLHVNRCGFDGLINRRPSLYKHDYYTRFLDPTNKGFRIMESIQGKVSFLFGSFYRFINF